MFVVFQRADEVFKVPACNNDTSARHPGELLVCAFPIHVFTSLLTLVFFLNMHI